MGYQVDDEQVQRLDAGLGLPGEGHPLSGLVTPQGVQRWLDQLAQDSDKAREGVTELAAQVGYSALVQALLDLGVLVEEDRWGPFWE